MPLPDSFWQYVERLIIIRSLPKDDGLEQPDTTVALPPDVRWAVLHTLAELYPDSINLRLFRLDRAVEATEPETRDLEGIEDWNLTTGWRRGAGG